MTYTIPNRTAGSAQTVTLYFAETYVTAAGQRLFSVSINGTSVLSSFDIYASAGGQNRAIARTFTTTANSSGQVVIQFIARTENPKVNGITVAPGGSPNPDSHPDRDRDRQRSAAPSRSTRAARRAGASPPTSTSAAAAPTRTPNSIDTSQITTNVPPTAVFQSERYGAMTYTIPNRTAGSAQTVTLYFAETYVTAAGQRLFNVSINGTSVLSSFDIYASAGGQNRAIARTFTTTANSSGQVVIQFISGTREPQGQRHHRGRRRHTDPDAHTHRQSDAHAYPDGDGDRHMRPSLDLQVDLDRLSREPEVRVGLAQGLHQRRLQRQAPRLRDDSRHGIVMGLDGLRPLHELD